MEIIIGKTAGACYGVKRAVEGAINERNNTNEPIYCLGEIVHNKKVVNKLEELGIKCIETLENANGTVLIRAHGIPKEIYDIAKKMNIKIQDFTCPNVLKVHKIANKFAKEDYFIFLLGAKEHPENIGTISHCGKDYYIFEKEEDISNAMEAFEKTGKKKLLLISQTTYSLDRFYKIKELIKSRVKDNVNFIVENTICRSTELRQKETNELSKKVNAMIIIGGKNSSNTKKLYEIAKKNCSNTFLIEDVNELELQDGIEKIGVMAGASTLKESIEEVVEYIKTK